ncbi:Eco57I restriction-modification methylase domain-containing protein [Halomicrococcus sp. NG-SE-24]|uniref:Eco57I restriction-modification methylase domain-containing protein n=1 Tax=Halomicrococcus sp. NG-SE-24 TaxID=3436928 RepID=UPI003D992925
MDALAGTLFSDRLRARLLDSARTADALPDLARTRELVAERYENGRTRSGRAARRDLVESVLDALGGRPDGVSVVEALPDERATVDAHADLDGGRAAVTDGRRWRLLVADEPPDRRLDVDLPAALDDRDAFRAFALAFGPDAAFERLRDARERHRERARTALETGLRDAVRTTASALVTTARSDLDAAFDTGCVLAVRLAAARFAAARGRDVADLDAVARWNGDLPFGRSSALADERRRLRALPDETTTAVVDALDAAAVDYAALDARDLGDAYERLLDADLRIEDGAVHLDVDGDRRRRRSAGAYYTPEHVVEYAVAEAVDDPDATVLDPATGSGHFLVRALDHLAVERVRTTDETLADARRRAARQVFGVDVDPLAVELARAAVWLRAGVWPDDRLRAADALGDGPEWFESGFDAVVGNPPYVRSRHINDERKADLRDRFDTAHGAFDLYVPFVERMCDLGERVCAVVPNKWTTARYGQRLRDRLLDRHRLVEVVDASELPVFADAEVYPVVVSVRADDGPTESFRVRSVDSPGELRSGPETAVSRSFVEALGDRVIPVGIEPSFAPVAERVRRECDGLGEHVTLTEGVHTGNVRDELVVDEGDDDCERVVGGSAVERYGVEWDGDWLRRDESVVAADGAYGDLRDPTVFATEKLLVPDISDRPVAAYDDEGLYALNTLYSVRKRPNSDASLRYVLAVVNSAFAAVYFRQVYGGTHVNGGYLRFKPMFAANLPLPDASTHEREELARLATRMCELRRERSRCTLPSPPTAGPRLADLDPFRVGEDTPLGGTTRTHEGLRLGRVAIRTDDEDGALVLAATARYRPEDGDHESDRWGFVETEPTPALAFDVSAARRELLRAFVPRAVDRGDVRSQAGKTISLLERLERLRLPTVEDAGEFLAEWRRLRELDAELAATDAEIDRRVCRAYGLDDWEVALVERLAPRSASRRAVPRDAPEVSIGGS